MPFVARPYSHNDPDDTVVFVSGHRLRRSYEFCRMYDEPIHWRDVHPCGQFLVVMVPQVSELINNYQFLTQKDLLVIASHHGFSFSSRIHKDVC